VYAYEGKKMVYDFLISSGLWGRTPTGKFKIWAKVRYQKMEGGFGPTYYNLPNVPYVMFFYNTEVSQSAGFSFHGTYWHDNFGHPMSHGCINMRTEDAALLYYWANPDLAGLESTYASEKNPGTTVEIYGQAPES
jgi:lipoprotein-anchoring transpeptidase ErfK/SrfK